MDIGSFKDEKFEDNLQEQRDEVFALQSIFNTDDEEKLKILSEVTEDKDNLFTLLVLICPKPVQEAIQVDVVVPAVVDEDDEELEGAAAAPPMNEASSPPSFANNIQLSRSLSGQRWQGSFVVKFLSPMNLLVTFPPTYPSSSPPNFHVSCEWLTPSQLEALESMLQSLWSEACHMPIIFTWVDWLENNCLSHLAITDQLMLRPSVASHDDMQETS
ncbi:LOW QUALITY PROTEIN: E3 ubiquitin-protein ligase rnf14 [Plakobranchus ocellatus]|uniref:E3 ubiquitin-protein ligase rnf14 n=1 Tax=Plakobranchus ocellatus TaxID=259542 RepID=A0AAV4BH39_9GAST|nr:LOW QUALITY PROTEIN: E3 ubiquitin-protein ligase rnf14 [Plakobranchus ocellatus]